MKTQKIATIRMMYEKVADEYEVRTVRVFLAIISSPWLSPFSIAVAHFKCLIPRIVSYVCFTLSFTAVGRPRVLWESGLAVWHRPLLGASPVKFLFHSK